MTGVGPEAGPGNRWTGRGAMAAILLLAAFCAGIGLNKHALWPDEALTALFGERILDTGRVTPWDGHNLVDFRGGIDLDQQLNYREAAPLQFYAAAASMALFGRDAWAARLPFLLAGLASLWLLGRWSATLFRDRFPPWLAPLILAGNVAFLLFIGQSRYYALTMALTLAILCAWSCLESAARRWPVFAGGAAAALALSFCNPINAAAAVAACVAAGVLPRFRTRRHVAFAAVIGVVVSAVILHHLLTTNTLEGWDARRGTQTLLERFLILMGWQIEGLGSHEFFPLVLLAALPLPWLWGRLRDQRPTVILALTVLGMMLAMMVVTAVMTPQDVGITNAADMRYVVAVLAVGPVVTATALTILAEAFGRAAAGVVLLVLVFSNILYGGQPGIQCTACERAHELTETHPSGADAIILAVSRPTAGSVVVMLPDFLTPTAMFYRPDLRYAWLLDPAKSIDPEVRRMLPPYLFNGASPPDILIVGIGSMPLASSMAVQGVRYDAYDVVPFHWMDQTRPEIPWHQFRADRTRDQAGIALFRRHGG